MPEFSFLETTAEVSVAFAGFIGIFLVLVSRDGRFAPEESVSIRAIVLTSVASVFYSAVPPVLYSLGVTGDTLWRISSGAIGLFGAVVVSTTVVPQMLALPSAERSSVHNLASVSLATLALLCCLLNALGWPWAPSWGLYLLTVWLVIAIAGINFVVLIFRKVL